VGLYGGVSTHDQQSIPLQTRAMRECATRRGWRTALQFKETGSGASGQERRRVAGRSTLCWCGGWTAGACQSRTCWLTSETRASRCEFCPADGALDLTTPAGRATAWLLSVFAESEREILRERARAGLDYARQNGQCQVRPTFGTLKIQDYFFQQGAQKFLVITVGCGRRAPNLTKISGKRLPALCLIGSKRT
jgi:hypothetical protein